jgi:hypothetical protein
MSTSGKLQTKIGEIEFTRTEANHVYIGTKSGEYVEVRGVKYYASSHLYLIDGEWKRKEPEYRDPYVSRSIHDSNYNKGVSSSARKVIFEHFLAAWLEWVAAHPESADAAERNHLDAELKRLDEKISEARKQLGELRTTRRQVATALLKVGGPLE